MTPPLRLPLRTARLSLRPFRAGDAAFLGHYRDASYTRFLPETLYALDDEQIEALVERRLGHVALVETGDALSLVIEHEGTPVGDVMLRFTDDRGIGEVGWVLAPQHHGRGYATEAAAALVDLGFGTYAMHRIAAQLDPENVASARLCARLGMVQEAHTRQDFRTPWGTWGDTAIWAILRSEWAERR